MMVSPQGGRKRRRATKHPRVVRNGGNGSKSAIRMASEAVRTLAAGAVAGGGGGVVHTSYMCPPQANSHPGGHTGGSAGLAQSVERRTFKPKSNAILWPRVQSPQSAFFF